MINTLHYFTTRGWTFESKNVLELMKRMSEEDKKVPETEYLLITFLLSYTILTSESWIGTNIYSIIWWEQRWERIIITVFQFYGIFKIYLLKERIEDLPKGQATLLWLKQANLYANGLFFAMLIRLFAWYGIKYD